jgi:cellulose synthase (UDP-forming)
MAAEPGSGRRRLFRLVAAANMLAGLAYLSWRYTASVNPAALILSVLLLAAESYGFLYALTMWKPIRRVSLPPPEGCSVDVFITTYNEPQEIVRMTAEAAVAIEWSPLSVYILDDGARAEMRDLASRLGCGYITRGEEWKGKDRHAKAGNVNNALGLTSGEFILMLDADQIPDPTIISKILGYFNDPRLAFVQSPQSFYNLPPGDPFGSDAPLFYGPIMRGKDGWNAAFFCGSNALLRREALMQVGLQAYAEAADRAFLESLKSLGRRTRPSLRGGAAARTWKRAIRKAVSEASTRMRAGDSLQAVSDSLNKAISSARLDNSAASRAMDFGIARTGEAIAVEGVSTFRTWRQPSGSMPRAGRAPTIRKS